ADVFARGPYPPRPTVPQTAPTGILVRYSTRNKTVRYHKRKSPDGNTRTVFSGGKQERRVDRTFTRFKIRDVPLTNYLFIQADLWYRRTASFSTLSFYLVPGRPRGGAVAGNSAAVPFPYKILLIEREKKERERKCPQFSDWLKKLGGKLGLVEKSIWADPWRHPRSVMTWSLWKKTKNVQIRRKCSRTVF
ncbi:unnamed protein product, partial [Ectocarpus sp. 12 AP-2014]